MDSTAKRFGRLFVQFVGAVGGVAAGWALFVRIPDGGPTILGVTLTVVSGVLALRVASGIADSALGPYDTAVVRVEGPISRDGGGRLPSAPTAMPADAVVDQVERADEDTNVEALVVHLNTPGGEVVPSDDIRTAVARFDGPTVAYATDVCASGGYWIASACDRIVAREDGIVGSIGVRGSRLNVSDLAERLGVDYERFVAGEYKDAGVSLRDVDEDEREYLQSIVDDLYDSFVERVADGRDLDGDAIRDTEARVYVGRNATDVGLVDDVGTMRDVEDALAGEVGHDVETREFRPDRGLVLRLRGAALSAAYALGAGFGSVFTDEDAARFRFR